MNVYTESRMPLLRASLENYIPTALSSAPLSPASNHILSPRWRWFNTSNRPPNRSIWACIALLLLYAKPTINKKQGCLGPSSIAVWWQYGLRKVEEFVDAYYAPRHALLFQLIAGVRPSRACQELLFPCFKTDSRVFQPSYIFGGWNERRKIEKIDR